MKYSNFKLKCEFADADDFHSKENVELMRSGVGLNDAQRHDWLLSLRHLCENWHERQISGVLACSALKAVYRHFLNSTVDYFKTDKDNRCQLRSLSIKFFLLDCSEELIRRRLSTRTNHYFVSKQQIKYLLYFDCFFRHWLIEYGKLLLLIKLSCKIESRLLIVKKKEFV